MPSKAEAQLGSHTQDREKWAPKENGKIFLRSKQKKLVASVGATIITNPNLVDLVDLVDGGTSYGNWSKPKNR
ncbi:hypothetical protein GBA52_000174 [Prunus armeniaca]|nr:hypothetical protein GBA52_000174 [Prunus armeniaca]